MSLEYNKELIPRAKELRKNMTRQEKHLWYDYLSAYPVRFQCQKTIGSFIVDFFAQRQSLWLSWMAGLIIQDKEKPMILNVRWF